MFNGICVVGSAHMDILASQDGICGVDQKGTVQVGIGGTAYNVACNLKKLGVPDIALISVLKDSIFGNIILSKLKQYGINTDWIIESAFINESVFITINNSHDILYAVNYLAVEDFYLSPIPQFPVYFADLNNSIATLQGVLVKKKPVYIGLVSEEKARKLQILFDTEDTSHIRCVSGNSREYESLVQFGGYGSVEVLSSMYPHIEFIYTMQEKGLRLYRSGKVAVEMAGYKKPDTVQQIFHSGAGDALISGYIYGRELLGLGMEESLEYAMKYAVWTKLLIGGSNLIEDNVLKNFADVLYKDQLTGVYNRHYLERRKNLIEDGSYCVMVIDIDKFKSINDTYGHDAGDRVIQHVARIIKSSIREEDLLLRWGGEEFVVLFKGYIGDAVNIAERIRKSVESTVCIYKGTSISVTVSIGLTHIPSRRGSFNNALIDADRLLYSAKEKGRNRIEYI